MRKTPTVGRFTSQLNKVNDQLCFSALQQWEFEQSLVPLVLNRSAEFTPAVFSSNPFVGKINRKIGDLPTFSREAEQVALRMSVIAGVEHTLAFLQEVQNFRQVFVTSEADAVKDDAEEEQLRIKILQWAGKPPEQEFFRTIGYLRHLRNHYAHMNETPHASFETYIRSYGTPLNKFWNKRTTDLQGIDFKTLATICLTPNLAIGVMNLLRVCIALIDCMVAETVMVTDAVQWVLNDIFRQPRNRQLRKVRILSKVKLRLSMDWNIEESDTIIADEVERALA